MYVLVNGDAPDFWLRHTLDMYLIETLPPHATYSLPVRCDITVTSIHGTKHLALLSYPFLRKLISLFME